MTTGWVYFIRENRDGGGIKIGTTAGGPHQRMRSFQTGNSSPLQLIGAVRGGPELERKLHERFQHCHRQGEWFEPTAELLAFIEGVKLAHEQPADDEDAWPFTEEQVEWLGGFLRANGIADEVEEWIDTLERARDALLEGGLAIPLSELSRIDRYAREADAVDRPPSDDEWGGVGAAAAVKLRGLIELHRRMDSLSSECSQHAFCLTQDHVPDPSRPHDWPFDAAAIAWLLGVLEVGALARTAADPLATESERTLASQKLDILLRDPEKTRSPVVASGVMVGRTIFVDRKSISRACDEPPATAPSVAATPRQVLAPGSREQN